jgi:hypothetical protein
MFKARETEPQEDATSLRPQKGRNGDTPLGYSERTALRRKQCDGFNRAPTIHDHCHAVIQYTPLDTHLQQWKLRHITGCYRHGDLELRA